MDRPTGEPDRDVSAAAVPGAASTTDLLERIAALTDLL